MLVDRSDSESLVLLSFADGRLLRTYKVLVGFSRMLTLDVDYIGDSKLVRGHIGQYSTVFFLDNAMTAGEEPYFFVPLLQGLRPSGGAKI